MGRPPPASEQASEDDHVGEEQEASNTATVLHHGAVSDAQLAVSRVPIVLQAQLVPATGLRQKVDTIQAALEIALPAGRLSGPPGAVKRH